MSTTYTGFSVENYRAFAQEQQIELKPLTLFFGWNSGGKSALVRFLPLLVESINAGGPPIWLAGEVGRNATWPELVCKATKRPNLKFGVTGEVDNAIFEIKWEINGDLAGAWQEVKEYSLSIIPTRPLLDSEDPTKNNSLILAINEAATEWRGYGKMPTESAISLDVEKLNGENDRSLKKMLLNPLLANVQWISGVRVRPQRLTTYGGGNTPTLKPDGSNAADHLIKAKLESTNDPILLETGSFFSALGEELVVDNPMEGAWRVMLRPKDAPDLKVNLCDTGEGYAQVLPVLVALARAKIDGPKVLCLEQPELHLHTKAQAELAKVLVNTVKSNRAPTILMETHSEVLLTSIQLAIANKDIAATMVRVYWIESHADGTSTAIPVDFDELGQPTDTTLVDAFSEAVELGRRLMTKQIASF